MVEDKGLGLPLLFSPLVLLGVAWAYVQKLAKPGHVPETATNLPVAKDHT